MRIEKYTFGMGDRFAHQGKAQLQAVIQAQKEGMELVPVWNKSNREHNIIGSEPAGVLAEARDAVEALHWKGAFHVDADHINLETVDRFIGASDFFTLDVADYTGKRAADDGLDSFCREGKQFCGKLEISGLHDPLLLTSGMIRKTAEKFLRAMGEAGRIYRHIAAKKGEDHFIAEVSVDETDLPQSPEELLLILFMLAREGVPVQTIAPKFSGRFNKGVDYVGEVARFEKEFEADLCVLDYAVKEFGLPDSLKLSVHSGSDKFSLYPVINRLVKKHGAGLHVKTAGTTWLEEVIGLAQGGGEGLKMAKEIFEKALARFDELVKPYASVVDIDPSKLPTREEVSLWTSEDYVRALRHDRLSPAYNVYFRQFIHVSFKIAAEMGDGFTHQLAAGEEIVSRNVTDNLYRRHILPIFGSNNNHQASH